MDFEEAETIFARAIEEEIELAGDLTLLKKFVSLWTETVSRRAESVSFLISWYQRLFLQQKPDHELNDTKCIFAVLILEKLLDNDHFCSVTPSDHLFSHVIRPLHEIIMRHHFNRIEQADVNIAIVLSFYKIHLKLSQNAQHAKQVKKYGLWKEIMFFYLKSNKFSFPIQNICTEYLNNLLSTECIPDELFLLLDIMTSNAGLIKANVEMNCYNDQILFRSLKLVNHVLLKNLLKLNQDAFNLISRKCHLLEDSSLKIAIMSTNISELKYALYVHVLLKYCSIAGDEFTASQIFFENLIHSVGDTLTDSKFFKYIPEVFCLFEKIFFCPIMQNLWIRIRVITCDTYLQRLSFSASLPSIEKLETSEKILHFCEKYRAKLVTSSNLPDIIDSMLKLMFNASSNLSEDSKNYLIHFMNCILKSFVDYDCWLSSDLCNLLINVIHATCALLTECGVSCPSLDDIFGTSINVCKLDLLNRTDIKLAAYNLCLSILKRKKLSRLDFELLKDTMIYSFQDTRWEVRDCALELWVEIFSVIPNGNKTVTVDQNLYEIFSKAVFDEESYVRASAYKVLSTLISLPTNRANIDCESLLLQTITKFSEETECNVRVRMIMFIQVVWENHKITNTSLLMNLYETIYQASSNDLHDEVRISGMRFWEQLVQSFIGRSRTMNNNDELIDGLACIGCLQVLMNALEDEYDLQIIEIAIRILELLLSIYSPSENLAPFEVYIPDGLTIPMEFPVTEAAENVNETIKFSTNTMLVGHSFNYINGNDFLGKYGKIKLEQMKNDKLDLNETLDLKNLLDSFKKVTFNADINEKDCY